MDGFQPREMFIDFPDTRLGKLVARHLTKSRDVERRLYEHGQKELLYFKTQIERLGKSRVAPDTAPNAQSPVR